MPDKGKGKHSRLAHGNARTTGRFGAIASAVESQGSTDHLPPTFSFKHVDPNNYPLHEWEGDEIKQLVKQLKMMEGLTWLEIKKHGGLRWKALDIKTLKCRVPDYIPKEQTLAEFRISQEMRVMGYRDDTIFCIVCFDRGHDVTG